MKKSFTPPFWKMMYGNHSPKGRGFTLIELLIVLVIIGIITALAVPKFERMILKSRMMTRVPVLEQMRLAEINYKNETGNYYIDLDWVEPGESSGDVDVNNVEKALGVKIPYINDGGEIAAGGTGPSSFVILTDTDSGSGWWRDDPRFAGYAHYSYASLGTDARGDAAVIMCYDDQLNVKKLSIKYRKPDGTAGADAPVDDIAVNE